MAQNENVQEILSTPFATLHPPDTDTFAVKTGYPASKALSWLYDKNILACPVCTETDDHEVVGLVDMVDLCSFAVLHNTDKQSTLEQTLTNVPVSSLINYSGQNNFVILPEKASFSQVVKSLARPGVHRVCLKSAEKSAVAKLFDGGSVPWLKQFVTQSMVVACIGDHLATFSSVLDSTIEQSGMGSTSVFSVDQDAPLSEGFKVMVHYKVSGIPVVDKAKKFVGNLSARDFCNLILANPPIDLNSRIGDHAKTDPSYTCSPDASLREVVPLLKTNHIHRVYILDKDGVVTSVLGLRDVLGYIDKLTPKSKEAKEALSAERKLNKEYAYKLGKSYGNYIRVNKQIVAVSPETPAFDAFQILCDEGLSALPVVSQNMSLKGLVDMADFTVYIIEKWDQAKNKDASLSAQIEKELRNTQVTQLCNYSKINVCYPQYVDVSIRDLFTALSRPGVHRVPLVNGFKGRFNFNYVEGFVTQSEAINFVAQHLLFFGSQVLHRKIGDIEGVTSSKPLLSVTAKNTAIEAFRKLHENNITAMPVLDDKGRAFSSISFRDSRFLLGPKGLEIPELDTTLDVFTKKSSPASEANKSRHGLRRDHFSVAVSCRSTDSILDVVHKLQLERTHRAFLVDDDNKPVSVISMGNLLNYLVHTLPYPDSQSEKEKGKAREKKAKEIARHAEIEKQLMGKTA